MPRLARVIGAGAADVTFAALTGHMELAAALAVKTAAQAILIDAQRRIHNRTGTLRGTLSVRMGHVAHGRATAFVDSRGIRVSTPRITRRRGRAGRQRERYFGAHVELGHATPSGRGPRVRPHSFLRAASLAYKERIKEIITGAVIGALAK